MKPALEPDRKCLLQMITQGDITIWFIGCCLEASSSVFCPAWLYETGCNHIQRSGRWSLTESSRILVPHLHLGLARPKAWSSILPLMGT